MTEADLPPLVYMVEEGSEDYDESLKEGDLLDKSTPLKEYVMDNLSPEERAQLEVPKYFYEVVFDKPGGLVMPLIVEYSYADGTSELVKYPVQVWRKNDAEVKKVIATDKEIVGVVVDPNQETADIDTSNNSWRKKTAESDFDSFKSNTKG